MLHANAVFSEVPVTRLFCLTCLLVWGCDDATDVPSEAVDQAVDAAIVDAVEPDPDVAVDMRAPEPDVAVDAEALPPDAEVDAALPEGDAAPIPPEVESIETRLGVPSTPAGSPNRLTCEALDAEGAPVDFVILRFEVRPDDGWSESEEEEGVLIGHRADTYHITCTAPGIGMRDETPARWDVRPGPVAIVRTHVEPAVITAGQETTITCTAEDTEGNQLNAEDAEINVQPAGAGAELDGRTLSMTAAGHYRVGCALPGAITEDARLVVQPALPAELVAAVEPDVAVHEVGSVVGYVPRVVDRFGNGIEAVALEWGSDPVLPGFGEGRYLAEAEGRYTLSVEVTGPTFEDRELRATQEILVDAGGPAIQCTAPLDGAMILRQGEVRLQGRVEDVAGLASLTIDGAEVPLDGEGGFDLGVQPEWGLNVHEVVATDNVGNVNSIFCTYFAADSYLPEDATLADGILLHLGPGAIDDGAPDDPIHSLTDLLRRVLNSPGLVQTLDAQLRAQNPVVPTSCQQRVLGVCVFRLGAEYRGMRVRGPNTVTSRLVNGGLRATVRIQNVDMDVKINGTVSNTGTLSVSHILMELTFGLELHNGRPRAFLAETNRIEVGNISSDFDGFLVGDLLDLIFSAFEGLVRTELTNALRDFLEGEIDALLSDVLSGLDLASLGLAFEVPGIAGGPATELALALDFSTLSTTPQRLQIGISTRATGPTRQAAPSAGVPMPPGPVRIELQPRGTAGAAINLGVLNQLVHQLWRAGVFHFDNAAALLGDLPPGASITLRVLTPPAVIGTGEGAQVRLFLGPAVGQLVYPGFFDLPLSIKLAATATADVVLVDGTEISFGGEAGIELESLHLLVEDSDMDPESRAILEADFTRLVQGILDQALNGALPSLPVPDFALPDSLAEFGVRDGTRLGLRELRLGGTASHFTLDGSFRE